MVGDSAAFRTGLAPHGSPSPPVVIPSRTISAITSSLRRTCHSNHDPNRRLLIEWYLEDYVCTGMYMVLTVFSTSLMDGRKKSISSMRWNFVGIVVLFSLIARRSLAATLYTLNQLTAIWSICQE
jgi:hypothetical protein